MSAIDDARIRRAPDHTIRPLSAEDSIADLTTLLHRAYKPLLDMGLRYLATHQSEEVTRARITKRRCFVAVSGERIVGTVSYGFPDPWPGVAWFSRPGVASVGQFAVEPELQRNGIGGSMLSFVEDLARMEGAEELALNTAEPAHHLIAYYAKRGYRVVDTTDATMPHYRSVIMSKRLVQTQGCA